MTQLVYLTDSYKKELKTKIVSLKKKGNNWEIALDKTIFYPQGGGQPSDKGVIKGRSGKAHVKHVRLTGDVVIHEATIDDQLHEGETVTSEIDWNLRYQHMRAHSAGHLIHEAVMIIAPQLVPQKGDHGNRPYIQYAGTLPIDKKYEIERKANELVQKDLELTAEFVSLEELKTRASYVPEHLPTNKPLRIVTIGGFSPIPDGGTQVHKTGEIGEISIPDVENADDSVRVYYSIAGQIQEDNLPEMATPVDVGPKTISRESEKSGDITAPMFISMLLEAQQDTLNEIKDSDLPAEELRLRVLGRESQFAKLTGQIRHVETSGRQQVGIVVNQIKTNIEQALAKKQKTHTATQASVWFDVTTPGTKPPEGHLHIVTQAIMEVTRIFERIGFTRVRHPEVDWDWYPFESLNMPPNHPARDEWETFFVDYPGKPPKTPASATASARRGKIVLTPHTSNGQVREMEKGKLPIRMINIAKCYRRQSDVSHVPMFHQFEGLYVDKGVSIGDLKGVFDFFVQHFYGPERKTRLRPFHFQFTEPSFEVDILCGVCLGKGCKLCKDGWLELGGAGMVHPVVLANGGVDTNIYNGFAFGWGVERTYMMKSGTKLDDIRLLYGNDVRFLEQF